MAIPCRPYGPDEDDCETAIDGHGRDRGEDRRHRVLAGIEPAGKHGDPGMRGVRPMAIEKAADGSTSRIFVQLSNLHGFAVVDFQCAQGSGRVKFPDEPKGYGAIEGRLGAGVPSHGIGIAPDGKSLWANSHIANGVFAYSLPDLKPLGFAALPDLKLAGREPIGAIPDWVTFSPDSKTIYVGNSTFNSVSRST